MAHYVFINKELDQDGNFKKVEVYGNLRILTEENEIFLSGKNEDSNYWQIRRALKNNRFENDSICIKKCDLKKSKRKK